MPELKTILRERFGLEEFRPFQETVCRALVDGSDALLVMPTGAGKSLCYQLPTIARGGTALVISPLIALMEDQVAALKARRMSALASANSSWTPSEGKVVFHSTAGTSGPGGLLRSRTVAISLPRQASFITTS